MLIPLHERIRDVVQGPDGFIYVATEHVSQGTAADGMVLRIEPAQ
jgi:glucose/arabinose dehydrogenase